MSGPHNKPSQSRKDPRHSAAPEIGSVVPIREIDTLESTMPPTPLRELLAADGASVFVLSGDASLLAIVQEAGGEQYPVFPAQSWQALHEAIIERRCGIALLDIDAVKGTLTDRLDDLADLNPHLVTLVAAPRDRADGLLNLLSERKIHRLLIKPPTVGITRLLLESSVNRHIEMKRRGEASPAASAVPASNLAGWRSWAAAGLLVVGVLGTVAVTSYLNPSDGPAVVVEEAPAAVAPIRADTSQMEPVPVSTASSSVDTALETGSAGDVVVIDAIDPATAIRTIDAAGPDTAEPSSAEGPAVASLGSTTPGLETPAASTEQGVSPPQGPDPAELESRYAAVEQALLADDLGGAEALLGELATVDPEASRLTFLTNQLARARELASDAAAAEEAAALAAAPPSELMSFIGLARTRLSQDQTVAPAGDSALDYYDRAAAIDAESPELADLASELGAAVLTAAEVELVAGRFAAAESLFLRARDLGVADADVSALELSLAVARESLEYEAQNELIAEADDQLARGQVFEPAGDNALETVLEVQALNPEHPDLADAFGNVQQALEPLVLEALEASNWDRAAAVIEALERAETPVATVDSLRETLTFGRQQAEFLTVPAPASELSVLELVPPVYPNRAIARGTEGWVDLQFVVDTEGRPRDVAVVGAEPADLFDEAAVAAAEQYVFVPVEIDGRVYERLVELRVRFALE